MYRRPDAESPVEVALVGRIRPRRWALPKGTPEVGETLEGTAVREVGEETGLLVQIEQPLDEIHYWFVWGGVRHSKTVHFYLMQMVGGDPRALGRILSRIDGSTHSVPKILLDHPDTQSRVTAIDALAGSTAARAIISDDDWAALRRICSTCPTAVR